MKPTTFFQNSLQTFNHLIYAFQMEAIGTQMMLNTYFQAIHCKWSKQPTCEKPNNGQLQQAHQQLLNLPKFLPFLSVLFLPLPGITELYLFAAIALERQSNGKVSLLPSQIKKLFTPKETK